MKRGDISNKISSLNIGIRLNDFLIEERQIKLFQKIKNFVSGQVDLSAVNKSVLRCISNVYYKTSMTVDLILVGREETKYSAVLEDICHNVVHKVEDYYGIEMLLRDGTISYYVTTPEEQVLIGGEYCLTLARFNDMLNKGLKKL